MSDVFFKPSENIGTDETQIDQIIDLFPKISPVRKGDIVAVKIHPGEYGNTTHIHPVLVRTVVDLIKEAGGIPFVTDTTVLYKGRRFNGVEVIDTAAINGFSHVGTGAPFICADGLLGDECVTARIDGEKVDEITVASAIARADSMIMISHCKGHPASGFGGAVKNLGMGCLDKAGKTRVHEVGRPDIDPEKCVGCNKCVTVCPWGAISVDEGKARVDKELCKGELSCAQSCKHGAIVPPPGFFNEMQARLGEAAMGPIKLLEGRIGYINWTFNLTPGCDCFNFSAPAFTGDIGILASKDPVALDMASIDLINKRMQHERKGQIHDVWGIDPVIHVKYAAQIGAGHPEYRLLS
ncbi:DUF362 domain-containing protein [Methanolobus halotolerans]|uniref:4Fe-4S ferredoxin n=1 Tax=Methanolobus halotolerans TaxID=2052935 RepID=A0A4E0Q3H3_9EURY|nr:DUF362 domain-containing protein [Methanolobus halotolerans]TGC07920.1 4Fe-4S ferredoxin [Methanolobus halotolerans]